MTTPLRSGEGTDLGRSPGQTQPSKSPLAGTTGSNIRPGDEQAALWLADYVRLRDSHSLRDRTTLADRKARITAHYQGLVESIARRFTNSGEPFEDMVQEGYLGLLSALENYNPGKGVKFSTYATHFIAGSMRHCLRDRGKIIKEPAWLHELSGKVGRASDTLTQRLGRAPHPAEIAQLLDLSEETVEEVLATRQVFQVTSFDAGTGSDASEATIGAVDPEKLRSEKPAAAPLPIEDRIVVENAIDKLKSLEQKVLYEFFYKDLNQTEIAKKMGISCNYVSHILKNSTKKLRRILGEAEVRDRGRIREASIVDPVTSLYAAAHILARAEEEVSRAARAEDRPLSVILIELGGVPASTSLLGDRRRDETLAACGSAVREHIRRVDMAGRIGDDTLLVLLPHTGEPGKIVAERLQRILSDIAKCAEVTFTARVGLGLFPADGRSVEALIAAARTQIGPIHGEEDTLPLAA